ncbi:hypothetical protein VKS41_001936 [Umbelopsis sp. WA50703]
MEAHEFPGGRNDLFIHHFIGDNEFTFIGADYDTTEDTYEIYHSSHEEVTSSPEFMSDEITRENVERGEDMQGIDWDQLHIRRDQYRQQRIDVYQNRNYENLRASHEGILKEVKAVRPDGEFYEFRYTNLSEKCSIVHFQLRNLLWAPSKNEIYYTLKNEVRVWSPQLRTSESVLNLTRDGINIKASTMACRNGVLVVGGNSGEFALKRMDGINATEHWGTITSDASGITNHIDLINDRNGVFQALISSNDFRARLMDINTSKITREFHFPWAVNCSTMSMDKRLLCAVGDATESIIADAQTGKVITTLTGHIDYSFACCWSPDDRYLATGNQDKTTRIYDIRNMSETLHVLRANVGAIRSLHFSSDGRHLAVAEPLDFVHIYDATTYEQSQVIDFFGEIAGVSFTPDDNSLFIANADDRVGSIMEFGRLNEQIRFMVTPEPKRRAKKRSDSLQVVYSRSIVCK